MDRIQELVTHVGRESLLRLRSFTSKGNVAVRHAAGGAAAAVVPWCRAAPEVGDRGLEKSEAAPEASNTPSDCESSMLWPLPCAT
jgi:hypothetical protein